MTQNYCNLAVDDEVTVVYRVSGVGDAGWYDQWGTTHRFHEPWLGTAGIKRATPTRRLPVAGQDLIAYCGRIYAVIGVWADEVWLRSNGESRIVSLASLFGARYTNVDNTIVGLPR